MGYSKYKRWIKSLQTKSSLALLITAAALIELTAAVQYWYAKKGIREEVEQRAKSELKVKNLEIQKVSPAEACKAARKAGICREKPYLGG